MKNAIFVLVMLLAVSGRANAQEKKESVAPVPSRSLVLAVTGLG